NVNHLMTDGASADFRRTIIPRSVHARLDIRLTPDTPLLAMVEIVERTAADHRTKNRGITFTVRTSGQPASYPSPARPASGRPPAGGSLRRHAAPPRPSPPSTRARRPGPTRRAPGRRGRDASAPAGRSRGAPPARRGGHGRGRGRAAPPGRRA